MHVPLPQVMPHPPQLCESVCVLMHVPPHLTSGDGQTQLPPAQSEPPLQVVPQPPQLFGSVFV
jgi:hypothetical protein